MTGINFWNIQHSADPTPEQLDVIERYAADHGDEWKCRLHIDWMCGGSQWDGPYYLLQRIWDVLGRTSAAQWLVNYRLLIDDEGETPKEHVGSRVRMSREEERRRKLKRKLDRKAKLAKKHARSTVSRKETP